jgi:hypothetical protein
MSEMIDAEQKQVVESENPAGAKMTDSPRTRDPESTSRNPVTESVRETGNNLSIADSESPWQASMEYSTVATYMLKVEVNGHIKVTSKVP